MGAETTERRFQTLDGLRGLASLVIVTFHFTSLWTPLHFDHGYLAVDLFFGLSGFVLARIYEPRFAAGLTRTKFIALRLARLYPLYILGTLIGLVGRVFLATDSFGPLSPRGLALATGFGALMLPSPTWAEHRQLFPLDAPAWSLLTELLLNVLFAFCWRASRRTLVFIVALSLGGLVAVRLRFGMLDFGNTWVSAWAAIPRGTFSFFVGMLIARHLRGRPIVSNWAWAAPAVVLACLYARAPHPALFDFAVIVLVLPACLAFGVTFEPKSPGVFGQLGAASYALYALHFPVTEIVIRLAKLAGIDAGRGAPWVGVGVLGALVGSCLAVDRLYDTPVRKRLTGFIQRSKWSALQPAAAPEAKLSA